MKPKRPCIVTTDDKFPDMVVMAVDNRVAALILAMCGDCSHAETFTSKLYECLRDTPDVDEIFQYLEEKDLKIDVGEAFILSKLFEGTKWEVAK